MITLMRLSFKIWLRASHGKPRANLSDQTHSQRAANDQSLRTFSGRCKSRWFLFWHDCKSKLRNECPMISLSHGICGSKIKFPHAFGAC
jgi:hypothetical protein